MPTSTKHARATVKAEDVKNELKANADPVKAAFFPGFFKAGPGEYAEGDQFFGVIVPKQRIISKKFGDLPLAEIQSLLNDPIHECRLTGLLILVRQYERAKTVTERKKRYQFYAKNIDRANNWDLVDSSAHKIAGPYCWETEDDSPLRKWISSGKLWRQRAAMIATLHFIKQDHIATTIEFANLLMDHPHDLIHKAVGWMLREAGKSQPQVLYSFLDQHAAQMPRTMLRYAIEKLKPAERKRYLAK